MYTLEVVGSGFLVVVLSIVKCGGDLFSKKIKNIFLIA